MILSENYYRLGYIIQCIIPIFINDMKTAAPTTTIFLKTVIQSLGKETPKMMTVFKSR